MTKETNDTYSGYIAYLFLHKKGKNQKKYKKEKSAHTAKR